MCGIIGVVAKRASGLYAHHGEIAEECLIADSIRGFDSTGVFGVTLRNEIEIVKSAVDPGLLMRSQAYKTWKEHVPSFRLIIGHNRKATTGEIKAANAHPFKEGDIVLVHNGMVADHKSLGKEVDVDSHALCHAFAEDGAEKTIANVRGAFALVWYNRKEKALYLWRNKERPLWLGEDKDLIYLASEVDMLKWILNRDHREYTNKDVQYRLLPENSLVKMTFTPFNVESKSLNEKALYVSSYPMGNSLSFSAHDNDETEHPLPPDWVKDDETINQAHLKETLEEGIEEDKYTAKEAVEFYPFNSDVVFHWKSLHKYTEEPVRWEIRGKAYMPGKPVFAAYIYTDANITMGTLKQWKQASKLLGKVKTILRSKNHITLHLDRIKIPTNVQVFGKTFLPVAEWEHIVKSRKCDKCNGTFDAAQCGLTSVNERVTKIGVYRVVCHKCVLTSIPKDKRDAIIKSCNSSLQNSKRIGEKAGPPAL